jgi:hypothetical protein
MRFAGVWDEIGTGPRRGSRVLLSRLAKVQHRLRGNQHGRRAGKRLIEPRLQLTMRKVSSPRGYKILLDIVPRAEPLKLVGCRSSFAIAGEQVSPHVAAEYLKSLWDLRRAANQPRRLSPSRRPHA